jgi:hypothetical protein
MDGPRNLLIGSRSPFLVGLDKTEVVKRTEGVVE